MMFALLLFAADPSRVEWPADALRFAENAFRNGVAARADAATAKGWFARAAELYDHLWRDRGDRNPALARNRGHARFLAGDLPAAVLALHDGLALTPWNVELQRSLEAVRDTIPYPTPAAADERMRPDPPAGLRHRLSPWDVFAVGGAFALLAAVGRAARATVDPDWARPAVLVGLAGCLLAAVAYGYLAFLNRRAVPPAVVTADGVTLRKGNGDSYPPRVEARLPRGAEVRVLHRRGGWAQVELPGGAVGWLPEAALLEPEPARG